MKTTHIGKWKGSINGNNDVGKSGEFWAVFFDDLEDFGGPVLCLCGPVEYAQSRENAILISATWNTRAQDSSQANYPCTEIPKFAKGCLPLNMQN